MTSFVGVFTTDLTSLHLLGRIQVSAERWVGVGLSILQHWFGAERSDEQVARQTRGGSTSACTFGSVCAHVRPCDPDMYASQSRAIIPCSPGIAATCPQRRSVVPTFGVRELVLPIRRGSTCGASASAATASCLARGIQRRCFTSWWAKWVEGVNPENPSARTVFRYLKAESIDPYLLPRDQLDLFRKYFLMKRNYPKPMEMREKPDEERDERAWEELKEWKVGEIKEWKTLYPTGKK